MSLALIDQDGSCCGTVSLQHVHELENNKYRAVGF